MSGRDRTPREAPPAPAAPPRRRPEGRPDGRVDPADRWALIADAANRRARPRAIASPAETEDGIDTAREIDALLQGD